MLLVVALIISHFTAGYPMVINWMGGVGLVAIASAIVWMALDYYNNSQTAPVRPPSPRGIPRRDDHEERVERLESSCKALERVVEGLRSRISEVQTLVDASGMRSEIESLQDLLTKELDEKKAAGLKAESAQTDAKNAREEIARLKKDLVEAQGDLNAKDETILQFRADLKQANDKLNSFLKAEADRLGEIVPTGLLESSVGERVRWCFEHSAKGDRLAAQILAALQSIKAAQDDVQLKGLLLSSLQILGQSLSRLLERELLTPSQKCDQFNEWSTVLNDLSASRFTITVPSIGARINLNTMVSSGSDDGSVTNVNCWGIRNEKGDLAYLAEIS